MSEPEEYSEPDVKSKLRSRKKGLLYMYTIFYISTYLNVKEPCRLRKTGLLYIIHVGYTCTFNGQLY